VERADSFWFSPKSFSFSSSFSFSVLARAGQRLSALSESCDRRNQAHFVPQSVLQSIQNLRVLRVLRASSSSISIHRTIENENDFGRGKPSLGIDQEMNLLR
jgi:hypothetical protein